MDESTKQNLVLGREYYANQDWERAEQMLRAVLEKEDRFADVHNMLGVIAHARGNFIAAEKHLERALEINAHYTEAALNLAVTYNDRGKYEKAREVRAKIQASPQAVAGDFAGDSFARGRIANMHAELAQAYLDCSMQTEAISELEKAVHLCPQFADLRTKLGGLLREAGDLLRAKRAYEEALVTRPGYAPARLQLGVTLLALGDSVGAEDQWKKTLELEPENAQAKMYLRALKRESIPAQPKADSPG
ncbi:MAG: tetratricopeptide repeat protein [Polyangiaceae bacterium]